MASGNGPNMRTMIPMAIPIETADWIPSWRVSAARARSVSSSSESIAEAATVPVAPVVIAPPIAAALASAAANAPGRTS